jgi:Transglutaminase-like superfamily
MRFLSLQAYVLLIWFDFYLARKDFAGLHTRVRTFARRRRAIAPGTVARICSAVDVACIWYWKEAKCLQRSAATACLLKRHGVSAVMVIGAQQMPFRAHAWVEVDGQVVNDKPYMPQVFAELERC